MGPRPKWEWMPGGNRIFRLLGLVIQPILTEIAVTEIAVDNTYCG
jgi:hypothetical protein